VFIKQVESALKLLEPAWAKSIKAANAEKKSWEAAVDDLDEDERRV
jgi:hypothetical protein